METMTPIALTIAGSDPSGGAGLQADLKTFHQHRVYGTSVVSLLTVQNTVGVRRVSVVEPGLVREQLETLLDDVPPSAAKTGALGSVAVVRTVAELARGFTFPLVVDPVMISKHGAPLLDADAQAAVREALLPTATLVTPNGPEAEALSGRPVRNAAEARDAARAIADLGCRGVLVKGGHLEDERAVDVLIWDDAIHELSAPRLATTAGHGTGCTLSAAIVARLALGRPMPEAVDGAKRWLAKALARAPGIGKGVGPVDHLTPLD